MRDWKKTAKSAATIGFVASLLLLTPAKCIAAHDPSFVLLNQIQPVADWLRGGHEDYCAGKCPVGTGPVDVPRYLSNPLMVGQESVFVNLMGLYLRPSLLDGITGSLKLRNLYISNTNMDDAACAKLAKCANLYLLDLSWDNVTAAGLKEIAKLEHLHSLKLRGITITPEMAQVLAAMPALDYLDISSTDSASVQNVLSAQGFANLRTLSLQDIDFTTFPQSSETPALPKLYTIALDRSSGVDHLYDLLAAIKSLRNIRAFELKTKDRASLMVFGKRHHITVFEEDYMNGR